MVSTSTPRVIADAALSTEKEVVAEEAQAVELLEADKERKLRELKDRHAAELAARSKDMSPEEVQQVFEERCLFSCAKIFKYFFNSINTFC